MARQREIPTRSKVQSERAKWAWDAVAAVGENDERYLTEARKLPARLLTSGLGQTMAYLHSKAGGKREGSGIGLLYEQLTICLQKHEDAKQDAMEIIVNLEPRRYRVLSHEMLATAEWIKRFAEGKGGDDS